MEYHTYCAAVDELVYEWERDEITDAEYYTKLYELKDRLKDRSDD